MIRNLKRYWDTLKYLKPNQFIHRANFVMKRKLLYKYNITNKHLLNKAGKMNAKDIIIKNILLNNNTISLSDKEVNDLTEAFLDYEEKQFTFLNRTIKFDNQLGWHDPNIKQLWRYNLHYFDYAREIGVYQLNDNNNERAYELYKELVESWIDHNKHIGIGDGWHSYTVSLRLVNWVFAYYLFHEKIKEDAKFKDKYVRSIYLQSIYLLENLEYDVYGNHLFENAKSLIIAGIFFNNDEIGERLRSKGESIMVSELQEQILSDGGHFELSPMYHSIVLKGLSELIYVYKNSKRKIPSTFTEVQIKMVKFLKNMLHPDGNIPLFNDAAFRVSDSPKYLFEYIGERADVNILTPFDRIISANNNDSFTTEMIENTFVAKESGYLVSKDESSYFILDFGKPCPKYLPAHAHADIFSYELSINSERIVTDTGTYEYAPGLWRNFNRSTKAHNTVTYNDMDQSEVWGSFRVAERAKVKVDQMETNNSIVKFSGSHNGYSKKYGITHGRRVMHIKDKAIVILDVVEGKNDMLADDIKSYIHLAPKAVFKDNKINTEENILGIVPLINTEFHSVKKGNVEAMKGWYSPEFGLKIPRETLVYKPRNKVSRQHVFGYAFKLDSKLKLRSKLVDNIAEITLSSDKHTETFYIDTNGVTELSVKK